MSPEDAKPETEGTALETAETAEGAEGAEGAEAEEKLPITVEVSEEGPCRRVLKVTVAAEAIDEKIEESYEKLDESADVKGFRRGHVPREILRNMFGEALTKDLRGSLVGRSLAQALEERKLKAVGEPELDVEKIEIAAGKEFAYEAAVEVVPDFPLPEYGKLKLDDVPAEVVDEHVERQIEFLQRRKADLEITADAARREDILTADIRITPQGGEKPAWEQKGVTLGLAADSVFGAVPVEIEPGALLGVSAGMKREVEAEIPKETPIEALKGSAGKRARVEIEIREDKRHILPPLDEAFAKSYGAESVEDLRGRVRSMREQGADEARQRGLREAAARKLLDGADFPLPPKLVERTIERDILRGAMRMAQTGIPVEDAREKAEKAREEIRGEVERRLRLSFLLERIAEEEKVEPDEAEVQEEVMRMASALGRPPGPLYRELEEEGRLADVAAAVRERKTLEWIVERADKEVTGEAAGPEKPAAPEKKGQKGQKDGKKGGKG